MSHRPSITIVIPAYNEAELLPRTLRAILPQALRSGAEVIVVDNNSTDATADMARQFGVRVITEPRPGYIYAVDRGWREARGQIIAYTDADSIVSPGWLSTLAAAFTDQTVVAATGPVRFADISWISWFRIFVRRSLVGSNMAIRRSALERVGGFDPRYNLGSDVAVGWRLKQIGRIAYIPALTVTTSARRFQSSPLREGFLYLLNHAWMVIFRRPLLWHFKPIRGTQAELDGRARRQMVGWSALMTTVLFAYFSAWPTSNVFGQITTRGDTEQRLVALTFDDGPNGQATKQIVDILNTEHVPATFFEVGRSVTRDPVTASYVADHGFAIGNHSWDHSYRLPFMTPGHIRRELVRTTAAITSASGQVPVFFRPPHGWRSPQLLYEVDRLHLQTVDWTVDPRDYLTNDAQLITRRVVRHVHRGSIILLHDGLQDGPRAKALRDRQATIAALPRIITGLRRQGYHFVSLQALQAADDEHPPRVGKI